MNSKSNMEDRREAIALWDKNLFTQKLRNLLLSETFIGGQLENHRRIKKSIKKDKSKQRESVLIFIKATLVFKMFVRKCFQYKFVLTLIQKLGNYN